MKPRAASAVVFSQNIIHKSVTRQPSVKCIFNTEIMLKHIHQLAFQVSDVEREGFFRCLNLFRVAQQHELKKDSCNSDDLINALYEECLTIRYSYLARGILKWENKGSENEDGAKLFCETREHIISDNKSVASDKTVQTHLEVPERNIENCDENSINAFLILSLEMWQSIISYLCVDVACKNLVIVFPILDEIKKNVEKRKKV